MSSRKKGIQKVLGNISQVDIPIVLVTAFLCVIGLVTIYSITSVTVYNNIYDNQYKYVIKQFIGIILGLIGILSVMIVPYRLLKLLGFLAIFINPILLIITLLIGTGPGDVKSWLEFGPLSLQPVELVKVGLILSTAWFVSEVKQYHQNIPLGKVFTTLFAPIRWSSKFKRWFLSPWGALFYTAVLLLFIMMQPDLGSGLIIAGMGIVMVLCSGIKKSVITQISVIVASGFTVVWNIKDHVLKPHQLERFLMWKDPFAYAQDIGIKTSWVIRQSLTVVFGVKVLGKVSKNTDICLSLTMTLLLVLLLRN